MNTAMHHRLALAALLAIAIVSAGFRLLDLEIGIAVDDRFRPPAPPAMRIQFTPR